MDYLIHLFILIVLYTTLSQGLNLTAGYTGMMSLTHAGFYGIGAYTTAILSINYGFSFWVNLPIAMGLCALVAIFVSFISFRTAEEYFIICTLGIQMIIFSFLNNMISITNGPMGISGIPPITFLGASLYNNLDFLILSLMFAAIIWYLLFNIRHSIFGLSLMAIREDEIFVQSLGKNIRAIKLVAFTLGAMLAAIPGTLYAHYSNYINPTSFTVAESIFILSIVIIGGMDDLKNIFFAAAFMVLVPEILRFIGISDNIAANMRQIIYGFLLIVVVFLKKERFSEK